MKFIRTANDEELLITKMIDRFSKQGQEFVKTYRRTRCNRSIYDVYKNPSMNKRDIEQGIETKIDFYMGCGYTVTSYNKFRFTAMWLVDIVIADTGEIVQALIVETEQHTYCVPLFSDYILV